MKSYDFEYDGLCLSDFGFIICDFGNNSLNSVSNGSNITFKTVSTNYGSKVELVNSQYEECLQATFSICKNPCDGSISEIDQDEMRSIMSWLNRKGFYKLKFLDENYLNIYYEASFNISRFESGDRIYGFELTVTTNRPFALLEERTITINNTSSNGKHRIIELSDEEGFIYPNNMRITLKSSGNLSIYNSIEDRYMVINNCTSGEIITMSYPIIQTSLNSHKIQNDFNWNFFRLANTYDNKINDLTISLPCDIVIEYSPIAKVGI